MNCLGKVDTSHLFSWNPSQGLLWLLFSDGESVGEGHPGRRRTIDLGGLIINGYAYLSLIVVYSYRLI